MPDYFVYYAESNIACFLIFGIMLAHDLLNADRQEKQIKYDHALIAFMLYFATDTVWAAVIGGVLPNSRPLVVIINFANYVLMATVTYMWLRYVMAVEQVPNRERRLNRFAVLFPFLVSTLVLITVYIAAPQVLLDENNQLQTAYYPFQITVPVIYIVAVLFYTIRKAKSEFNRVERRQHLYIGIFPLAVILAGVAQVFLLPGTSLFCFACTLLMLIFYIRSMETQISIDALTGLGNRGQLRRFVSQEAGPRGENQSVFVMMIDVNNFKMINDTYGHAEGDRALVIIANSLKAATDTHGKTAFLARYGGDEFVVIIRAEAEKDVEALIGAIRAQIERCCEESGTPYTVSVGVGYDVWMAAPDTFQKCMQRADHKLYIDKEHSKLSGKTTVCR